MLKLSFLTIFPQAFESFLALPIPQRAVKKGVARLETVDIRPFADGSFRHLDDSPFGGGVGMVMRCAPVLNALESVKTADMCTVLLSPKGKPFSQELAHELAQKKHIALICGHYEGVDARVETAVDLQISIGDYVLTGGELAAQVIADAVLRLLPDVLRQGATAEESHENGRLEYPQYTQPANYKGMAVPPVLLSGNDAAIRRWRQTQSLLLTKSLRPDLLEKYPLTDEERELLQNVKETERRNES